MLFFYDENEKAKGIYEIRNRASNKSYIGQTMDKDGFKGRWRNHINKLNSKKANQHLKNSYNFYKEMLGHDNFFEFHILEIIENPTATILNERETYWIAEYEKEDYILYNVQKNPKRLEKYYWSYTPEQSKEKLRKINTGKKHSEETKKKISLTGTGKHSGANNSNYGKHPSNETRKKMSDSHIGLYRGIDSPNTKFYVNLNLLSPIGELTTEIHCLAEFCRKYKLEPNNMNALLKGRRKICQGWTMLGSELEKNLYPGLRLLSPSGELITKISNLTEFCKKNNLKYSSMSMVVKGKQKFHNGWELLKE